MGEIAPHEVTGRAPDDGEARRRSSFARTAASTFGTNVAVALLSLVNVLIVARTIGATGRGEVAFLITVTTLSAFVGTLGIQESNSNLAGSHSELRPRLATNSILLAFTLGAIVALVVAVLVVPFPALGGEVRRTLLWMSLATVPIVILRSYLTYLVQADYHFAVTNVAWVVGPVTTAITNGSLAALGALDVVTAIAAWIGGQAIATGLLIGFVAKRIGFGPPDVALARQAITFGAKAHVGHSFSIGNYRIDQWFLGVFSGSRELGLYSVAVAWAEVLFYLPELLMKILRPDLVRVGPRTAAELTQRLLRITIVLSLGLAIFLVAAAPLLCTVIFGDEFTGSVDDLRVLALSAVGIAFMALLGGSLIAQGRPLLTAFADGSAFVFTLALDLALIPVLGGLGAAIATSVAWTCGGLMIAVVFARALQTGFGDMFPRRQDLEWVNGKVRTALRGGRT
jgi:O-antigen/teichoic acid export membrane protein